MTVEFSGMEATTGFSSCNSDISFILIAANRIRQTEAYAAIACSRNSNVTFASEPGGSLTARNQLGIVISAAGQTCRRLRFVNGTSGFSIGNFSAPAIGAASAMQDDMQADIDGGTFQLSSRNSACISSGSAYGAVSRVETATSLGAAFSLTFVAPFMLSRNLSKPGCSLTTVQERPRPLRR
jgi:hypothetical protein